MVLPTVEVCNFTMLHVAARWASSRCRHCKAVDAWVTCVQQELVNRAGCTTLDDSERLVMLSALAAAIEGLLLRRNALHKPVDSSTAASDPACSTAINKDDKCQSVYLAGSCSGQAQWAQ